MVHPAHSHPTTLVLVLVLVLVRHRVSVAAVPRVCLSLSPSSFKINPVRRVSPVATATGIAWIRRCFARRSVNRVRSCVCPSVCRDLRLQPIAEGEAKGAAANPELLDRFSFLHAPFPLEPAAAAAALLLLADVRPTARRPPPVACLSLSHLSHAFNALYPPTPALSPPAFLSFYHPLIPTSLSSSSFPFPPLAFYSPSPPPLLPCPFFATRCCALFRLSPGKNSLPPALALRIRSGRLSFLFRPRPSFHRREKSLRSPVRSPISSCVPPRHSQRSSHASGQLRHTCRLRHPPHHTFTHSLLHLSSPDRVNCDVHRAGIPRTFHITPTCRITIHTTITLIRHRRRTSNPLQPHCRYPVHPRRSLSSSPRPTRIFQRSESN